MSLQRRLDAVEAGLGLGKGDDLLGTLELHYTRAWPECRDDPCSDFQQCPEHGEACGVSVSRIKGPPQRVVIVRGAPWLGG